MKRTPFVPSLVLIAFLFNTFGPVSVVRAQDFVLPAPGVMVHLSPDFNPPILKGIKVNPNQPFEFEFVLDKGDGNQSRDQLKEESSRLIKYFLASLTIPEKDLWVNLSPYEKDRIVPESFGRTEMGRDLLAEDYMLKQITASLIYPEDEVGKKFWKRIYEEAAKKYGTTNIPVNTFNKVWIVPEKAVVYENAKAGTAYVVESKLKVMLEQDYLSLEKHEGSSAPAKDTNQLGSQIVREIVIPELTKEINENKNFAKLRQVYNSLILATWYKKKIKDSVLTQVYADRNKITGVDINDPLEKEKIYQQYLKAFKKGVYNYIKEESDPISQEKIPRKYFSGGFNLNLAEREIDFNGMPSQAMLASDKAMKVAVRVNPSEGGVMEAKPSREQMELYSMFRKQSDEDFAGEMKKSNMEGFLRTYAKMFGITVENLRNRLDNLFKERGYKGLLSFVMTHEIEILDKFERNTSEKILVAQKIRHDGRDFRLVVYHNGHYIENFMRGHETSDLKGEIYKKIQNKFSQLSLNDLLKDYPLRGPLSGIVRIYYGDHAIFLRLYKEEGVLAIIGYARMQTIHGADNSKFNDQFFNYLTGFQKSIPYVETKFEDFLLESKEPVQMANVESKAGNQAMLSPQERIDEYFTLLNKRISTAEYLLRGDLEKRRTPKAEEFVENQKRIIEESRKGLANIVLLRERMSEDRQRNNGVLNLPDVLRKLQAGARSETDLRPEQKQVIDILSKRAKEKDSNFSYFKPEQVLFISQNSFLSNVFSFTSEGEFLPGDEKSSHLIFIRDEIVEKTVLMQTLVHEFVHEYFTQGFVEANNKSLGWVHLLFNETETENYTQDVLLEIKDYFILAKDGEKEGLLADALGGGGETYYYEREFVRYLKRLKGEGIVKKAIDRFLIEGNEEDLKAVFPDIWNQLVRMIEFLEPIGSREKMKLLTFIVKEKRGGTLEERLTLSAQAIASMYSVVIDGESMEDFETFPYIVNRKMDELANFRKFIKQFIPGDVTFDEKKYQAILTKLLGSNAAMLTQQQQRERIWKKQSALTEHARSLAARFPQYSWINWEKASLVPWSDCIRVMVKGEENGPGPETDAEFGDSENRWNYWSNQMDVREDFLNLIASILESKGANDETALLESINKTHDKIINGKYEESFYSSQSELAIQKFVPEFEAKKSSRREISPDQLKQFHQQLHLLVEDLASHQPMAHLNTSLFYLYTTLLFAKDPTIYTINNLTFSFKNHSFAMNLINTFLRLFNKEGVTNGKFDITLFDKYERQREKAALEAGFKEFNALLGGADSAQLSEIVKVNNKDLGGIDLTAEKTPLEIQNAGEGIKFHLDPAQVAQLQNAPGFTPIIVDIQPMIDLRLFLGINQEAPQIPSYN